MCCYSNSSGTSETFDCGVSEVGAQNVVMVVSHAIVAIILKMADGYLVRNDRKIAFYQEIEKSDTLGDLSGDQS